MQQKEFGIHPLQLAKKAEFGGFGKTGGGPSIMLIGVLSKQIGFCGHRKVTYIFRI